MASGSPGGPKYSALNSTFWSCLGAAPFGEVSLLANTGGAFVFPFFFDQDLLFWVGLFEFLCPESLCQFPPLEPFKDALCLAQNARSPGFKRVLSQSFRKELLGCSEKGSSTQLFLPFMESS